MSQSYLYQKFDGDLVGHHNGAHYYTIGQRKGISIGGRKNPLYVLNTDVKKNIVYVGEGADHPGLYRLALRVLKKKIHFVSETKTALKNDNLKARIRYRQALQKVSVFQENNFYYFVFEKPQKSITSGQFIAVYSDDELVCSGVIH